MRGKEFPMAFSFEFAGLPLDLGQGTSAGLSGTAGPTMVRVLPVLATVIDSRLTAYLAHLEAVLAMDPGGVLEDSDLLAAVMQITADLVSDVLAIQSATVAEVETVQELSPGDMAAGSNLSDVDISGLLLLLSLVEESSSVPGVSLGFVATLSAEQIAGASDVASDGLSLAVKLIGGLIASNLSLTAEADIIQKCEPEAEPFIYPAPPPSPWWPEDFFIYQAPEQLQGLDRPLIGEIWGEPPWVLRAISGEGSTMIEPELQKVPFQIGETFLNSRVNPRVIAMTIRVIGQETTVGDELVTARRNLFFLRNLLSQALVVQPLDRPEPGERPPLGRLIYFRQNYPVFALDVIPRDSPQFLDIPGTDQAVDADIELVAPDPYWKDQSIPATRGRQSRQCWFYPSGGMEFAMSFSFEFTGQIYVREILNRGDVRTPIVFEQRGPIGEDGLTLSNDTTGESLVYAGPVAADETLVISTEFGQKYVRLVNQVTGEVTDVFSRLDFKQSAFWQLTRGINKITLMTSEAAATTIGRIMWHNRFSGV